MFTNVIDVKGLKYDMRVIVGTLAAARKSTAADRWDSKAGDVSFITIFFRDPSVRGRIYSDRSGVTRDVSTTMIYTDVPNPSGPGVQSPAVRLLRL